MKMRQVHPQIVDQERRRRPDRGRRSCRCWTANQRRRRRPCQARAVLLHDGHAARTSGHRPSVSGDTITTFSAEHAAALGDPREHRAGRGPAPAAPRRRGTAARRAVRRSATRPPTSRPRSISSSRRSCKAMNVNTLIPALLRGRRHRDAASSNGKVMFWRNGTQLCPLASPRTAFNTVFGNFWRPRGVAPTRSRTGGSRTCRPDRGRARRAAGAARAARARPVASCTISRSSRSRRASCRRRRRRWGAASSRRCRPTAATR